MRRLRLNCIRLKFHLEHCNLDPTSSTFFKRECVRARSSVCDLPKNFGFQKQRAERTTDWATHRIQYYSIRTFGKNFKVPNYWFNDTNSKNDWINQKWKTEKNTSRNIWTKQVCVWVWEIFISPFVCWLYLTRSGYFML